MTWIVVGFVLMTVGLVAVLVTGALLKAGRITNRRRWALFFPCYAAVMFPVIFLSDDPQLGSYRWLSIAVVAVLSFGVGLPLHFWSRRERRRIEAATPKDQALLSD